MQIVSDLHLHSRFSRAVSPQMTIDGIAGWAIKKGINLVATGDWTHPMWMREIGEKLEETGDGLLKLKTKDNEQGTESSLSPFFLLSTEISCIFSQGGKTRRVHVLIWVPTIAAAQKISKELMKRGCNLLSDGRPIIGLSLISLSELILTIEPNALIVPAHIWTPWFSVYGKMGGFESLDEAFGEFAKQIYAVETGLSSSPDMNWRIKDLDSRAIVSFSDAHSGPKLGREVTVFDLPGVTYKNIEEALKNTQNTQDNQKTQKTRKTRESETSDNQKVRTLNVRSSDTPNLRHTEFSEFSEISEFSGPHIAYTIEFYPEEGKYHYTGHRDCNVRLTPEEIVTKGTTCSVCGKPLTQGVMQRVEEIAKRDEDNKTVRPASTQRGEQEDKTGLSFISGKDGNRPPFLMLVPLQEIIAEAIGSPVASKKTQAHYETLVSHFNGEFIVLLTADLKEITKISTVEIADGVRKVRSGDIVIDPGYDGVFGVVKIWKSEKEKSLVDKSKEQIGMF